VRASLVNWHWGPGRLQYLSPPTHRGSGNWIRGPGTSLRDPGTSLRECDTWLREWETFRRQLISDGDLETKGINELRRNTFRSHLTLIVFSDGFGIACHPGNNKIVDVLWDIGR
jgi:hypothetical protein